ncbi:hypothetical protein [Jeotgalibacillus marinus]|uniref:Uncharacterized protein n=1 Tax=Jeotgalibacillus marinus TaxID=86667 RepID=A0ABV3Q6Y1_9BACL
MDGWYSLDVEVQLKLELPAYDDFDPGLDKWIYEGSGAKTF